MAINFIRLKSKLPKSPGVYFMKDKAGGILYVGKAGDLRRRVSSYFERPQDARLAKMLSRVFKIHWQVTETVIEALVLEAELIKRYSPIYNVKDKDDKSFLYVIVTREKFPRVLMLRYKEAVSYANPLARFGPFTSPTSLREALKILRHIFLWSSHDLGTISYKLKANPKPCFDYQIGLCPGTCIGAITAIEYRKNIRQLIRFFRGEKKKIISELGAEMRKLAKELRYEEAAKIRGQLFALEHIHDVALISSDSDQNFGYLPTGRQAPTSKVWGRVEGYDISNISGTSAVGAMAVFENGVPAKPEYRKFKIRTVAGANDVGMMAEVLRRRLAHPEWPLPDAILVDGGTAQVNAARGVLINFKLNIPVIGLAKGPERKRNDFIYPLGMHQEIFKMRNILVRVRDEAHRFAIKYHRELRSTKTLKHENIKA